MHNYWEADDINNASNACLYLGSNSFWGAGSRVKVNGLTIATVENAAAMDRN